MVNLSVISGKVDIAKSYYLELIEKHRQKLIIGCDDYNAHLDCIKLLVKALEFDIKDQYNTDLTQAVYKALLGALVGYSGSYDYDPNTVIPGQTFVISGGASTITRTNLDLLQDNNLQWYLPLFDDAGVAIPATSVFAIYNGASLPGIQLDITHIPYRIYGFIDNSAATIQVTYTYINTPLPPPITPINNAFTYTLPFILA
jgi:hypothetical protein